MKIERMEGEEGKERMKEDKDKREGEKERKGEEWKEKIRELERRWKIKEKGDRRKNIVIRRVRGGKGKNRENVEKFGYS